MNHITRGNSGARFRKADLHVHTPGSYDYKQKSLDPSDLVDAFIDEGLELVVAADHNCTGWFRELHKEANSRPESLEVLPGVEITTPQGGDNQIHVVGVFPPDNSTKIQQLLGKIDVDPTNPSDTQASQRIPEICEHIQDRGGLPILAHIDGHSGAHTETESGNIRDKIFDPDRVAAIEVVSPSSRHEYPEFPAVRSSDAHSPDELGRGYTYLKMTQPSFEGLQTALSDPDSRIRFEKPEYTHGYVTGVRFNGDFLNDRAIQVSPNLNCLIGGKGTGKSTVIEQVRFAFDIDPQPDRIQKDYRELVEETLGTDGEVEVQVMTDTGEKYIVKRQFSEEPHIFRTNGTDTGMDVETFKSQFFDLEIHSQGELLELARDPGDQLELIDSYLDFEDQKTRREELKSELRTNAQNLESARKKIERLESEIKEHEALQENLEVMRQSGVEEVLDDQDAWDNEQAQFSHLEDTIEEVRSEFPEGDDLPDFSESETAETPNQELVTSAEETVSEALDGISKHISQIHAQLDEAERQLENQISEWSDRNDERKAEYEELADEIEEETGVDIDEYFELKDAANKLESLRKQRNSVLDDIEEIERERRRLLKQLRECRTQITDIRRTGIQNINESLNNIRVRLISNGNRESYSEWFDTVLRGSNVRTSDKRKVTESYDPESLFDIIRKRHNDRISQKVGLTKTATQNIVEFDQLRNQLHELQIQELYDKPIIELKHEGTWKPLGKMSDGQKCTALLSIALLEREKPLIIDQPEDMLDNEYIYDEVVKMAREVKESRQIISATHNANMPILGDAEKINVMYSNGLEGFIHERGSIDDPDVRKSAKEILEGGDEAFIKRTEKYGALQIL